MQPTLFPDAEAPVRPPAAAGVQRLHVGAFDGKLDAAFDLWLAAQLAAGRASSTRDYYATQWHVFRHWLRCRMHGAEPTIGDVTVPTLQAFVADRQCERHAASSSDRYKWRLVRMLEQVLEHHAQAHDVALNPAAARVRESSSFVAANDSLKKEPPRVLTAADATALIDHVGAVSRASDDDLLRMGFTELRNRAATALHLGSGIAPGELRTLRPRDVAGYMPAGSGGVPFKLTIVAKPTVKTSSTSRSHDAVVAPWAGQALRVWMRFCEATGVAFGQCVFPGSPQGTPWARHSHWVGVQSVMRGAGLSEGAIQGGIFPLRHTFAHRQIRRGTDPVKVAAMLGVSDVSRMNEYAQVLVEPETEVV